MVQVQAGRDKTVVEVGTMSIWATFSCDLLVPSKLAQIWSCIFPLKDGVLLFMSNFIAWWVRLCPFHGRQLSGNLAAHGLMSSLYYCPIAHGRPTALCQKDNNSQRIAGLCSKILRTCNENHLHPYVYVCVSCSVVSDSLWSHGL